MKNTAGVVLSFFGGLALGALLGILFAPESGEETRKKIIVALEKRGIKLSDDELDDLMSDVKTESE